MEAQLASQQEAPIAEAHEDTRLQQEASELYEQGRATQSDDVQQLAEGIEERAPSGWDNAVEGLFGEGGEAHQALRSLEDATNGLITVPGAPGAGFGTDEYWEQVGWNALIAATMEATIPLVIAGVPMAVRKGAYVLRTPKATRQAASELRTAASEAHSATLQYQALRGGKGTEQLLRTERAGDITGITPAGMHPAQAVRTPTGQVGPMSAETSAAYQQMVTSQHRLAQAVDKVDGMPAGWTLQNNRWMGLSDDLMLHRGGTPVYYARPGVRETIARSPGSRTVIENMPRPPSSLSSSQATTRLEAARQRMLAERARHQQVVSGMDEAMGPSYPGYLARGKPGTPATTNVPTTQPPGPLSYQRRVPEELWVKDRWNQPWYGEPGYTAGKFEYIGTSAPRTWTARSGPMRQHEQFVERSWQQAQRATKEYDDLIQASGRQAEGLEAAEGLELLRLTLGKK